MLMGVVFSLNAMMMPIIGYLVLNQDWRLPLPFLDFDYNSWRIFLLVCGLPGFLCGLVFLTLPESPKFLLANDKYFESINALRVLFKWNGEKENLTVVFKLIHDLYIFLVLYLYFSSITLFLI